MIALSIKHTHTHTKSGPNLTQTFTRLSCGSYISDVSCPLFWWLKWLVKKHKIPRCIIFCCCASAMDHPVLWLQHIMRMQLSSWPSQERITGIWAIWITTLTGHCIYILKKEQLTFFMSSFLTEVQPFHIYGTFSWKIYSLEKPISLLHLGTEETKFHPFQHPHSLVDHLEETSCRLLAINKPTSPAEEKSGNEAWAFQMFLSH